MKLCIRKTGGSIVNMDQLTATRGDVAAGDKFYGAGSDGIQSGALVNNQDIQKNWEPMNRIPSLPESSPLGVMCTRISNNRGR